MFTKPGWSRTLRICLWAAIPFTAWAVETHIWNQSDLSEFDRGTAKHLSIRSDGHIVLAPVSRELDSTSIPYLWAVAQDSKGTVYYGGGAPTGTTTKVFALAEGGKPKMFAELPGLEVHAVAIDKQDRLYAAVLPDAKIYRVDGSGMPQLFFDPKCKYVWAMAFDRSGNLFVATGDSGLIFKVTPDGKGTRFFDSQETHARSMLLEENGNLIVGTEPGGLVMRITPEGKSFVLYQTSRREVTALAERDGVIYAASVGNKILPVVVSGAPPVLPTTPAAPASPAGTARAGASAPSLPPSVGSLSASVVGGSELIRIQKDGYAERIWNSPTELVYALAFDGSGRPLIGTGNRGIIYRLDSDQLSTQLLTVPPTQITAFLPGLSNTLYAVTGNVGNLYAIFPGLEKSGTLTSEVLDAREFTYWGKAHLTTTLRGGTIGFETRSGNLNNPETNWSSWKPVVVPREGGQVPSPPARFLQYRLQFSSAPSGSSPELSSVEIAYLPKNIAPRITTVEVAPSNYRQAPSSAALERSVQPSGSPTTLTLPAVGQRRSAGSSSGASEPAAAATLQYNKGYVTLRWNAVDPNNDPLLFKVEVRGKTGGGWRLLKDKLPDRFYAFDGAAFQDGEYIPRISASDVNGNIPSATLTASLEGEPFTIDNTPPEILDIKTDGGQLTFTAKDALSWIDKAEYSLNGSDWTLLDPVNKVTDSQTLSYRMPIEPGQTVAVRVFDEADNVVVRQVAVQ